MVYNVLNVDAARLARQGHDEDARRMADAAAAVEASHEFRELCEQLATLDPKTLDEVLGGDLPSDAEGDSLRTALIKVAQATENARPTGRDPATDTITGEVAEVHDTVVVVRRRDGVPTVVPRWMAAGAHRERRGETVVVVTERLGTEQAMVEVMPAVAVPEAKPDSFSPFGRRDPRITEISASDVRLLAGLPAALHVPIPVAIEN